MSATTSVYVDPNTGGVQAGLMNFRNGIINGNFDVWQRGTTFNAVANNAYTADRWQVIYDGTGVTRAITQQAFSVGQTDVPNNPKFWLRFATSVAGTGGTYVAINQKIEGVRSFAGKTITMSMWLKASSSTGFFGTGQQVFGSGGSYSSVVGFPTYQGLTATTTWQKYTVSVQMPSISGKLIGTNNDDYLLFAINFSPNTTFTFDIAQVQVEEGQRATPFEMRPFAVELQLCQRYFEIINCRIRGYTAASEYIIYRHPFKVEKRSVPSAGMGTSGTNAGVYFTGPPFLYLEDFKTDSTAVTLQTSGAGTLDSTNKIFWLSSDL
jgi:hypothetical protein